MKLPPSLYQPRPDTNESWRVYELCKSNARESSTTVADFRSLTGNDKNSAFKSLKNFLDKVQSGLLLQNLYDETQCHEAHTFKDANNKNQKIHRIWGTGTTRIYFVYLPNKNIVVLKTCPKREDKLTIGEKTELEELALLTLDCAKNFESRLIKDPNE